MGMFSSLFGSSGSDKADKMRQQALDAFNAVKTPELSSLQVQLQNAVVAGKITPEEAEAQLLSSNAFNEIKTDPSLVGAQKQALQALQDTASQGGLTAIDKSKLQDIRDQQEQETHSSNDAIMANARARGTGNSNLTTTNQLIEQQNSANRAAKAGTDVAAQAQARALAALTAAGTTASTMRGQDYGEQSAKAAAQNDIDKFNAVNKTDVSKFNTANDLAAQGANVGNAQHVSDTNTANKNAEIVHNADANQTIYNDEMQKAAGKAGVLNNWANDATAQKKAETGADMALTGGAINGAAAAGGFAMGGPAGAAFTTMDQTAPAGYKPKMSPNQSAVLGYSDGGEVKNPENPNASLEEEYNKFVQSFCNGGTVNMADGGKVHIKPGKKDATLPLPITSTDSKQWQLSDPNHEPIGEFPNYADAATFAEKVKDKQPNVQDFLDGGKVPGKAPVTGDSPQNDIVPAKLSPDEVVASRTEADNFKKLTGTPLEEALKRLKSPQSPQVGSARG